MPRLRVHEIHTAGRLRVVAIESLNFIHHRTDSGYGLFAHLEPHAVIIIDTDRIHAVGIDAQRISLCRLRRDLPALDEILAPYRDVSGPRAGD